MLIIDEYDGYIDPAEEPFEVLTPAQIGCEPFDDMALRYDVLELSTAVKPWLLDHLLAAGDGTPITYLDPDIEVYGSLEPLDRAGRGARDRADAAQHRAAPADGRAHRRSTS